MAKSKSSANSLDIFGNMQKLNGKTSSEVKDEGLTSPEPVPKYHITFLNESDVFAEYEVEEGEAITYPETLPTKAADSMFRYHFKRWNKDISTAKEDTIIQAEYEKEALTFPVIFQVEDTVIKTEEITYGALATAPTQLIEKADDEQFHYVFSGWEPAITTPVTGPTTFIASFSKTELPKEVPLENEVPLVNQNNGNHEDSIGTTVQAKIPVLNDSSEKVTYSAENKISELKTDNITSSKFEKETDNSTVPMKAKVGRPATKKGIAKKVNVLFTEDTMEIINTAKVFFDGNMTKYLETLIMEDYKKNKELYDTLAKTKRV